MYMVHHQSIHVGLDIESVPDEISQVATELLMFGSGDQLWLLRPQDPHNDEEHEADEQQVARGAQEALP